MSIMDKQFSIKSLFDKVYNTSPKDIVRKIKSLKKEDPDHKELMRKMEQDLKDTKAEYKKACKKRRLEERLAQFDSDNS
jgi:predicted RNA-binding protein with RPS1 domain